MTKGRVIGVIIMVLGLFLILVPLYIFPVCGVGRYAPAAGQVIGYHGCHGTLRAEVALGIIAIGVGVIPLLRPRGKTLLAASVSGLIIAVLVVLFPAAITGVCMMATMPCRTGTLPALVVTGILMGAASAAGLFLSRDRT